LKLRAEDIRFKLVIHEILNRVKTVLDLANVHQGRKEPTFELSLAESGLAIVHKMKERALDFACGCLYYL
jgi:hypothetical protein